MTDAQRVQDPDGRFSLVPPPGWNAAPDEDSGGLEVWSDDGDGTLHLISFEADEGDYPDPAEELYAFLEERGVELEEDEVEDVPLEGGAEMARCEYEAEDEDEGDTLLWIVGVATAPGALVFATYFSAADAPEAEREAVRRALGTLRLAAAA
ncbi:MAG TPA: hypothetical protein VFQ45_04840 [Longimicrobium sp.]|nr:hypothetical protein [Longimicrobium sp.]